MDVRPDTVKLEWEQKIRLYSMIFIFAISAAWILFVVFSPDLLRLESKLADQKAQMLTFPPNSVAEEKFRLIVLAQIDLVRSLYGFIRMCLILLGVSFLLMGVAVADHYRSVRRLLRK